MEIFSYINMDWSLDLGDVRKIMSPAKDDAIWHVYRLIHNIGSLFTRADVESPYIREIIYNKISRMYSRRLGALATQWVPSKRISNTMYIRRALDDITRDLTEQARSIAAINRGDDVIYLEDIREALRTDPNWQRGPAPVHPD